ncbi:hypothetical protein RQP46_003925 [Phenoliferia psychrophenolica]
MSRGKLFPFADQLESYVIPERYLVESVVQASTLIDQITCDGGTLVNPSGVQTPLDPDLDVEKCESEKGCPQKAFNPYLVTWDGPDDQDNPQNWSKGKKVYIGSAIYTPSIPGIMEQFDVGQIVATLGLSLFIFGYGISPNMICTFLFALFQMPIVLAKNFETILVFRFLTGLLAGPAMSTGGASMMDIFHLRYKAYAIASWAIGATGGPIMGGYAGQIKGWRWPIYELLWLSSIAIVILFVFLPETLGENILHKRAVRLRKLTGNKLLRSQSEIDEEGQSISQTLVSNIERTFIVAGQPAVMFANVYLGFAYGCFYCWFEVVPLVFGGIYGFSEGAQGLVFVGFVVAAGITYFFYIFYQKIRIDPRLAADPEGFKPEERLEIGIFGAFMIPISLLIFGWCSRADVPWIVPFIGCSIYLGALFLLFQGVLMYLTSGYHEYSGPILAGNNFFRSSLACIFPLFGARMFIALSIGGGCSLLAGFSILMIPVLFALKHWGPAMRAKSKFT